MVDNEELWRTNEAACTSDESAGDAVYVAVGPYRGDSVIERIVIATGERTPQSTALDRLELSGVITELEDVTFLKAYRALAHARSSRSTARFGGSSPNSAE